jgi:hypothetical protein
MSSELDKHKKSDGAKWCATLLAVILLAGACATSIVMGVKHNGWFEKKTDTTEQVQTTDDTQSSDGDDTVTPVVSDEISEA